LISSKTHIIKNTFLASLEARSHPLISCRKCTGPLCTGLAAATYVQIVRGGFRLRFHFVSVS